MVVQTIRRWRPKSNQLAYRGIRKQLKGIAAQAGSWWHVGGYARDKIYLIWKQGKHNGGNKSTDIWVFRIGHKQLEYIIRELFF